MKLTKLALATAPLLAASTIAAPTAYANNEAELDAMMRHHFLSSGSDFADSVSVQGDECTITIDRGDMPKTTYTYTRAEAKEKLDGLLQLTEANDEDLAPFSKLSPIGQWSIRSTAPLYRACAEGKDMSPTSSQAHTLFSSANGDLSPEGLSIIAGGTVVLLGLLAAVAQFAMPAINPQITAMLPF